jgi:hypothetical protein
MSLLQNWSNSDLWSSIRDKTNTAINTIGKILVSGTDTTFGYLFDKIAAGSSNVTVTKTNAGGNEIISIDVPTLGNKLDSSKILIASTNAPGPTSFQAETTVLTLTPSASKASSVMKITFAGYVTNGAGSVAGSTLRIKKNGTEVAKTVIAPPVGGQDNFTVIWYTTYSAGDIITATAQCSNSQTVSSYILLTESFDAV